jgi:hypothetical protein
MKSDLKFSNLKLRRTEFRFSNKKSMNRFFDNALIESSIKFVRLMKQFDLENIHVSFSRHLISRTLSVLILLSTVFMTITFTTDLSSKLIGLAFSLLLMAISLYYKRKFNRYCGSMNLFGNVSDMDQDFSMVEALRQDLINERSLEEIDGKIII